MENVDGNLAALRAYERKQEEAEGIISSIVSDYKDEFYEISQLLKKAALDGEDVLSSARSVLEDKGLDIDDEDILDYFSEERGMDYLSYLLCLINGG